jgi:molecular chaperone IbpA
MTGFDFAPLFRTAIGFDRLAQLMDTAASAAEVPSYPPYNIEKTGEDTYRLTMAVAGFRPENLEMVVTDNNLVVSGRTSQEETKSEMLHRVLSALAPT